MKTLHIILITALLFSVFGCASTAHLRGTVIDAETGKPIEGAVVRAEWNKRKWMIEPTTHLCKEDEVFTDSRGRFDISAYEEIFFRPPPIFVIYKKGYIAWRENAPFPSLNYGGRKNFNWKEDNLFRLERFIEGVHSHNAHTFYIEHGLETFLSGTKLGKAYEWECLLSMEENSLYNKKEKESLKKGENKSQEQLWKEVLEELYLKAKEKSKDE